MTTFVQPRPTTHADASESAPRARSRTVDLAKYLVVGMALGAVLVKSEVISWYRIQEMFRFQSFHMYGVLGSAMITALISIRILKLTGARAMNGDAISIPHKQLGKGYRYWIGGMIFGVGWALTGACPGPLFTLIGSGATVFVIVAMAALAGTWTYGLLRPRLPH